MQTPQDINSGLIVQVESNTFEFQNPLIERVVSLTPADRKWMDDIVQDVNEGWNENDPQRPAGMQCVEILSLVGYLLSMTLLQVQRK